MQKLMHALKFLLDWPRLVTPYAHTAVSLSLPRSYIFLFYTLSLSPITYTGPSTSCLQELEAVVLKLQTSSRGLTLLLAPPGLSTAPTPPPP